MTNSALIWDEEPQEDVWYANIALPLRIPELYTYRIPAEFIELAQPGIRVVVEFGKQRIITGLIDEIHQRKPEVYNTKPILDILDAEPIVTPLQIDMLKWMSEYYLCTYGEVVSAALPSGLKLSSESKIQLHPNNDWNHYEDKLDDLEVILLKALSKTDALTYAEAAETIQLKSAFKYIKSLVQKELIIIFEELKEKYRPKKVTKIRLQDDFLHDEAALEDLFKTLESRPKQSDLLLFYLRTFPYAKHVLGQTEGLDKRLITQAGLSSSSLKTLLKNGVFTSFEEVVSRFNEDPSEGKVIELSERQEEAKDEILKQFQKQSTILFHGVTGSGKTEIYIHLIEEALANGNQVLYLLPEIALTAQIVNRLKAVFGDRMGVYHSKFSDNERVEVWQGLLTGSFDFIIGVRSAIFLPFRALGLIIVDEEHETSYKQFDPAPRYHARDVALYLAQLHHAKSILGSATPAIESFTHAKQGKYGYVALNFRYHDALLPEIVLADLKEEKKKKTAIGDFSSMLIEHLQQVLDQKEQAIIFQNRRGFSNYLTCEDCGYIPECHRCAVSLTYHQYKNQLNCHYCGHKEAVPVICPACGSTRVHTVGIGTEKIEEELKLIFPKARIKRMDLETTRSKYAYQHIISDFEKGSIDFLVGTQMVSKGLDFDKVSLVGVFDVDRMMYFPDFRSHERTFQMVTQVSGRAGRRSKQGKVIVQTRNIEQRLLQWIQKNDYLTFYENEMREREKYAYPPFSRMIHLLCRDRDKKLAQQAAIKLANLLKSDLGESRVLGPQEPLINKIRDKYLVDIHLKVEKKYSIKAVKKIIKNILMEMLQNKSIKKVEVVINVDPY